MPGIIKRLTPRNLLSNIKSLFTPDKEHKVYINCFYAKKLKRKINKYLTNSEKKFIFDKNDIKVIVQSKVLSKVKYNGHVKEIDDKKIYYTYKNLKNDIMIDYIEFKNLHIKQDNNYDLNYVCKKEIEDNENLSPQKIIINDKLSIDTGTFTGTEFMDNCKILINCGMVLKIINILEQIYTTESYISIKDDIIDISKFSKSQIINNDNNDDNDINDDNFRNINNNNNNIEIVIKSNLKKITGKIIKINLQNKTFIIEYDNLIMNKIIKNKEFSFDSSALCIMDDKDYKKQNDTCLKDYKKQNDTCLKDYKKQNDTCLKESIDIVKSNSNKLFSETPYLYKPDISGVSDESSQPPLEEEDLLG